MTWRNRTTTLRHPHNALPTNHNGAAPPRPRSPHQSHQHSATQTRLSPAITTAQRRPDQALPSNHNGTAPPRPSSPQQSQRHSTAQTSNHNGTAPPRPGSPHQSPRHSATNQATPLEADPKGTAHRAQNERSRSLTISFPKSERTRSRPQTPQTKTRTLRYAFGKNTNMIKHEENHPKISKKKKKKKRLERPDVTLRRPEKMLPAMPSGAVP